MFWDSPFTLGDYVTSYVLNLKRSTRDLYFWDLSIPDIHNEQCFQWARPDQDSRVLPLCGPGGSCRLRAVRLNSKDATCSLRRHARTPVGITDYLDAMDITN